MVFFFVLLLLLLSPAPASWSCCFWVRLGAGVLQRVVLSRLSPMVGSLHAFGLTDSLGHGVV
jgi:hypothetical protein